MSVVPSAARKKSLANAAMRFHAKLMEGGPILEYFFQERGFTEETVRRFQLGEVPHGDVDYPDHAGWAVIPYLTPTGFVDLRFRNPDPEGKPKYKGLPGATLRMFNPSAILQANETLVLAEGECLLPDAEVLTRAGWVSFAEYQGEDVAQWDDGELDFVKPQATIKKRYEGDIVHYKWRGYEHVSTPGHRMPVVRRDGTFTETTAENAHPTGRIPRAGILDGPGISLTDDEIRLLIAVSADGSIRDYGGERTRRRQYIVTSFTKARKVDRLARLLNALGIEYSSSRYPKGYWGICFHMPDDLNAFKLLPWEWIELASARQREMILDELLGWDGNSVPLRTQHEYSSKHQENAEWVQALCHTSGRCSSIMRRSNAHGEWFKVSILNGKSTSSWQMARTRKTVDRYKGNVHCVTVPSGFFLTRINGIVSVTGNCDTMILNQVGLHAIGIPGASAWRKPFELAIHGFDNIIICEDGDDSGAGKGLTGAILKGLDWAKAVRFEGTDVNEFYISEGAQALRDKVLAPVREDEEEEVEVDEYDEYY